MDDIGECPDDGFFVVGPGTNMHDYKRVFDHYYQDTRKYVGDLHVRLEGLISDCSMDTTGIAHVLLLLNLLTAA